MKRKFATLTLCGSFGFGNIGDEAIPQAITDMADTLNISLRINLLSRFDRPKISNVIGLGPQDDERRNQLAGQPILLVGGGIIEADKISTILRCIPIIKRSFSPRIVLFAASVEPGVKYSWFVRRKIKRFLKDTEPLYVRDVLSAETLQAILPKRNIEVIGDTVLWLKARPESIPNTISLPDRYIAVALAARRWEDDPSWYEWIAEKLIHVAILYSATIVFTPMSCYGDDDRQEHGKVVEIIRSKNPKIRIINIENELTPPAFAAIIKEAIVVISMRLHGSVIAYAQETPFVSLAYHPKLIGFSRTVGWERFVIPKQVPELQSKNAYGYRFRDLNTSDIDFEYIVKESIDYSDFSKLPFYKNRLAKLFYEALEAE